MKPYRIQITISSSNMGNTALYENISLELTFEEMCKVVAFLKIIKEESKQNATN